jgi:hypothetical protein
VTLRRDDPERRTRPNYTFRRVVAALVPRSWEGARAAIAFVGAIVIVIMLIVKNLMMH